MKCMISLGLVIIVLLSISSDLSANSHEEGAGSVLRDCEVCPEMVIIPAGSFEMGAEIIDQMRTGEMRSRGAVRTVDITKSFAAGRYEVTNAEYKEFVVATNRVAQSCRVWGGAMDAEGFNWRDPDYGRLTYDNEPVVCVYWNDAVAYASWLAEITGLPYRLLTEAEWEYAANGGSETTWPWGKDDVEVCKYGNILDLEAIADPSLLAGSTTTVSMAAQCNDGYAMVAPVGSFKPNGFGLYDMVGNVWEWVQDCSRIPYPDGPVDGSAFEVNGECEKRSIRSGSWRSRLIRQKSTFRGADPEPTAYHIFGFRVGRDLG